MEAVRGHVDGAQEFGRRSRGTPEAQEIRGRAAAGTKEFGKRSRSPPAACRRLGSRGAATASRRLWESGGRGTLTLQPRLCVPERTVLVVLWAHLTTARPHVAHK